MTELRGSLRDVGLLELVHALAGLRVTGRLRIWQEGWSGEIALEQGRVVAAVTGQVRGRDALEFIALALAGADFCYTDGPPAAERNVDVSVAELQVELVRLASWAAGTRAQLLDSAPRVSQIPDDWDREVTLSHADMALLREVDGRRSAQDIIRGRDAVRVLRSLVRLTEAGILELPPRNAQASPAAATGATGSPLAAGVARPASVPGAAEHAAGAAPTRSAAELAGGARNGALHARS